MFEDLALTLGISSGILTFLIFMGLVDTILKAICLWHSAQRKQIVWFICIVIFNTMGVLPLIYLLIYKPWKKKGKK